MTPNQGAIVGFSPTGLGVATAHDVLQKGLFSTLFSSAGYNAGVATTEAKYYFHANTWGYLDLIDTYLLFGDPAARIKTIASLTTPIYLPLVKR